MLTCGSQRDRLDAEAIRQFAGRIPAMQDYISGHNQNPRIFARSVAVERTFAKVAKYKEALDAVHQGDRAWCFQRWLPVRREPPNGCPACRNTRQPLFTNH